MYLWNTITQTSNRALEDALAVLHVLTDAGNLAIIDTLRENGAMHLLEMSLDLARNADEIEEQLCHLKDAKLVFCTQSNDGEYLYALNHHRLLRIYAAAHRLGKTKAGIPSSHE